MLDGGSSIVTNNFEENFAERFGKHFEIGLQSGTKAGAQACFASLKATILSLNWESQSNGDHFGAL